MVAGRRIEDNGGMRRVAALAASACLLASGTAEAAQRCTFKGAKTLMKNGQARVFWVPGRGDDRRVYFGCLRDRRPILLTADRGAATNSAWRLAGTWVAWRDISGSLVVRALAGTRSARVDVSRYTVRALALGPDGALAWILGLEAIREVGGLAPGARVPTPIHVGQRVRSASLTLAGGRVGYEVEGRARSVVLTAPPAPPTGRKVGPQGLDARFGDCGTLVPAAPAAGVLTEATQLAAAADGKVVAAGTTTSSEDPERARQDTFVVARLDGERFDTSFARAGVAQLAVPGAGDARLTGAVVQGDGRVVVAGHVDGAGGAVEPVLMRLTADGTLDPSFGLGGVVRDVVRSATVQDVALAPSGALLIAGQRDGRWYVARLTADGTLDRAFGTNGMVADSGASPSALAALAVTPGGTIYAGGGGQVPLLLTLTPDGTVAGRASADVPAVGALRALQLLPGSGVLAAGTADNVRGQGQVLLARFRASGRPLRAFGRRGAILDPGLRDARDVALDSEGRALVSAALAAPPGGTVASTGVARYLATGRRDVAFGHRGFLGGTSSFGLTHHDLLPGADGTVLVAQDNAGAFAVSRIAAGAPATAANGRRSTVCAMATSTDLATFASRIDVSLRLRAPGPLRLDAVVVVGGRRIPAGRTTTFSPLLEGAVAAVPLTTAAREALAEARTARLIVSAGAPGGARTTHRVDLKREDQRAAGPGSRTAPTGTVATGSPA